MAISDLTTVEPVAEARRGPSCAVCLALDTLPADESTALVALLSNSAWRYQGLSEVLEGEGLDLPAQVLSRHARGRCAARTKLR